MSDVFEKTIHCVQCADSSLPATVFDTLAEAYQSWRPGGPYTYGIYGTPTTLKLAARIAEIENARLSSPATNAFEAGE